MSICLPPRTICRAWRRWRRIGQGLEESKMSASDDVAKLAEELTARGEPFVFATVVRTIASVAAKPGAKAIVDAHGRKAGRAGGGCALGAVKKASQRCLDDGEARLISVMPFDQLKAQGL